MGTKQMDRERVAQFEELFTSHAPAVRMYAVPRVGLNSADDVVSEVFAVAWRKLDDVPSRPRGWLLATARRVAANHRRAEGRRKTSELPFDLSGSTDFTEVYEVRSGLLEALRILHPKDREVVVLTTWFDLTHQEVAEVMGCSTAAVTVRLHRARAKLRRILTDATNTLRPTTPEVQP